MINAGKYMTNLNFKQLDKLFRNDDFPKIENDSRGVRFLKLRSMSRKETMEEFCSLHNVDIEGIMYLKMKILLTRILTSI